MINVNRTYLSLAGVTANYLLPVGPADPTDPFQMLLDLATPTAIRGNWRAMQHLPAAREALNCFLRDQLKE